MARASIGGEVLVRLGDGVPERIDLVAGKGGRSEFVRKAVLAALDGGMQFVTVEPISAVDLSEVGPGRIVPLPTTVRVAPKPVVKAKPGSIPDAAKPLVDALRDRRMTAREASAVLGWPVMRVEAAAKALGDRIAVRAGGVMELVDADR